MPPRPHPLVLASLAFGCVVVMALVLPRGAAGAAGWRWPLRGPVVGAFHVSPRAPFARGQRRGIDVSARARRRRARRLPGARDASPGRCRAAGWRSACAAARWWRPTSASAGSRSRAGSRVAPRRRRSARSARPAGCASARAAPADRRGYVDPLPLLADGARAARAPGPRRGRCAGVRPPARPAPRPIARRRRRRRLAAARRPAVAGLSGRWRSCASALPRRRPAARRRRRCAGAPGVASPRRGSAGAAPRRAAGAADAL